MKLDSWEKRRELLIRFQSELIPAFPDESDYYPKALRDELYVITRNYQRYLERQEIKKKYLRWDYLINKARLEKEEERVHGRHSE